MRRLLAIWVAVGFVGAGVACGSAMAAVSGDHGRLSNGEYTGLRASEVATKKAFAGGTPHWPAARKACLIIGQATELMQADSASCLNGVVDFQAWLGIPIKAKQCTSDAIAAEADTTGGLSTKVVDELVCVNSAYQGLAHEAPKLYAGDSALRNAGIKRGFTGKCLITLVPTKQQLFFEKRYAEAATEVASDVGLLVKIQDGTAKKNAVSGAKIGEDQAALQDARNDWLGAAIGYPFSVCPHA